MKDGVAGCRGSCREGGVGDACFGAVDVGEGDRWILGVGGKAVMVEVTVYPGLIAFPFAGTDLVKELVLGRASVEA